MRRMMLALVVVLIAGCGEQRFDATSEETVKASIEQMGKSLSQEDKVRFARGVMGAMMKSAFRSATKKKVASPAEVARSLHGLTASQIMELGDEAGAKASGSPPATGPRG